MWRLFRAQVRTWWYRPLAGALVVGAAAACWELFGEARGPSEWRAVWPLMLLASMVLAQVFVMLECREKRFALLLRLPTVSRDGGARSRVLLPALLYLGPAVLVFALAVGVGSVDPGSVYFVGLVAWTAFLAAVQQFEIFWGELKFHLERLPLGRYLYFAIPALAGGVFGGVFGARVAGEGADDPLELLLPLLDGRTAAWCLGAAVALVLGGLLLFRHRESFVR